MSRTRMSICSREFKKELFNINFVCQKGKGGAYRCFFENKKLLFLPIPRFPLQFRALFTLTKGARPSINASFS